MVQPLMQSILIAFVFALEIFFSGVCNCDPFKKIRYKQDIAKPQTQLDTNCNS
ncbi:hypothetical protein [Leptospira meyeri]|uniref:hypothetical protein n=1 Tax=Leptospira meyeri TaxID=29508 RepID=UPI0013FD8409|nr:hypothetical protein [Leptospira meyeri]